MILAAGRGERLRPVTDKIPKPMIRVGDLSLIEHHLIRLASSGFKHIVINVSHLADKIVNFLGDGEQYGVKICYSPEPQGALDTGGGIVNALDKLKQDRFLVVNGDVFSDFNFPEAVVDDGTRANLVLVQNPQHNPDGDFCLNGNRIVMPSEGSGTTYTFAGIGWYSRGLFTGIPGGRRKLAEVLRTPIAAGEVRGQVHGSLWVDVGTPERLAYAKSIQNK
jgi:MurNAc alpha-1-phosphate uridylyltransferase